jgi:hypothetical protein
MYKKNKKTPPPPSPLRSPPPPIIAQSNPQPTPGFFGNMIQGMALGAGSSIGHKMVDSVFNGKETKDEPNKVENMFMDNFNQCMKDKNDISECKILSDMYVDFLKNK